MVRGSRDSKWGGAGFGAILADFVMVVVVLVVVVVTDVRGGTSGSSRDVPIFVQFHEKIRTVSQDEKEKKIAKKWQIWGKKYEGRKKRKDRKKERE